MQIRLDDSELYFYQHVSYVYEIYCIKLDSQIMS